MNGVAVVGAGRVGLPWAAVLAHELRIDVTCIDTCADRVETINRGHAPFSEPQLQQYVSSAVEDGRLTATTDPDTVTEHEYVAVTINNRHDEDDGFLSSIEDYAQRLTDDHVFVLRSTLPVSVVGRVRERVERAADGSPAFTVFPERLAEGKAISEIETLPKVVGTDDAAGRRAMQNLLGGLDCEIEFTSPETAMFVKLIDNSYRDALFSIANQIAFVADELELDAFEAIEIANHNYDRNEIPNPGPVSGKCLPKDPHFLMDEQVCDQPRTPDLFTATRRTNARYVQRAVREVMSYRPSEVAVLGLSYKRGVADTTNSHAVAIAEQLADEGVSVSKYDPHVPDYDDVQTALQGADLVLIAVNHPEFGDIEATINEYAPGDSIVFDLWGMVDRTALDRPCQGIGRGPDPESDDVLGESWNGARKPGAIQTEK
ncbi:nucleotide sugar dehydrogenase [Halomicrobium salinisoli]|uniref:nucleotide sugar dehydrogenase n=1 Tax=Halomicrobium salinisoli TaxID=2878391 RepID=UPI001CF04E14|nr:nucleotide sugar dehydrogenase [Halomicrobium salinisoli]